MITRSSNESSPWPYGAGAAKASRPPKAGIRVPPRTPWDQQRAAPAAAPRAGAPGGAWPARYVIRRTTWHLLDHAGEIEDRSA
jgi:hypothetical protein